MDSMNSRINCRKVNSTTAVVEIQRDIDVYTSPRIKNHLYGLIEEGYSNLIVNLEKVSYIDATGNGILIEVLKEIKEKNGFLGIVCTNPQIKKIFTITGLIKIFNIFKSEEEALSAI